MVLRPTSSKSPAAGPIATRDAAQNDAFLREVDEALREDEFFTALQRHGKPALAAIAAGLALLAAYLWWGNYREGQLATHSEQFTLALDQLDAGNLGPASAGLASLASGNDGSAAGPGPAPAQ